MPLPRFDCLFPETVEEAVSLMTTHGDQAQLLAGGTGLLGTMKQRLFTPKYVVNLKRIRDLDHISWDDAGGLRIGALTLLDSIAHSPEVKRHMPLLGQAAETVASPHLRNAATLGGNLCLDSRCWHTNRDAFSRSARESCWKTGGSSCFVMKGSEACVALVAADTVPALMVLGAEVEVVGARGRRAIALEGFYERVGTRISTMEEDEILTEVRVPALPKGCGGNYVKHAMRDCMDFPIVGVGVLLRLNEDGLCEDIKICVGAAAPSPVRCAETEAFLVGNALGDEVLEQAGELARQEVRPIVNLFAPTGYKRHMVGVLVVRAVKQAIAAARSAKQRESRP